MKNENLPVSFQAVKDIVSATQNLPVFKPEDVKFLVEKSKHIGNVIQHTYMWRTDNQKLSIINDVHFPTLHSKYHQAMLEQKVQFDQTMYLAKDFELKKLEIEEMECELEELTDSKRDQIKNKKLQIEMQFKQYELKQMQIAMEYRMKEVKGWQNIQESLMMQMKEQGMEEDRIWNRQEGEMQSMFFVAMNNLQGLKSCTDSAERTNLTSLAVFVYKQAKQAGLLEKYIAQCDNTQLDSLKYVKEVLGEE
jgi:hypothetical protein